LKKAFHFLIFLFACFCRAQTLQGVISDDLSKPLESANIIAKPLQEKASLKFAIIASDKC